MADPITITTTFITLATFIKDLIEVGQSIKRSIEKVAENRRCIRELTDDVLHTLADLANLTRGQEDIFQAPALSSALGDLKANMIYVHSTCLKIRPVQRGPGLRGLGSQIMIWMKRDDVEGKIRRLKEHVNKCYLQFAVFAVARIEQRTARIEDTSLSTANTTLRLEQTLMVNQVENQVRWRQVEVLMARMLLETEFGENIMNQTIEIISSDPTHQSLEFRYLSTEVLSLVNTFQKLAASRTFVLVPDTSLLGQGLVLVKPASVKQILHHIIQLVLKTNECPLEIPVTWINEILALGNQLGFLHMISEFIQWEHMAIQLLRSVVSPVFDPDIVLATAFSYRMLSLGYQSQLRWDLAIKASRHALELCRSTDKISPTATYEPLLATILLTHSESLLQTGWVLDALSIAQEAVEVCCKMTQNILNENGSELTTEEDKFKIVSSWDAFFGLAKVFSCLDRPLESYESFRKGFDILRQCSGTNHLPSGANIDYFIDQICKVAESGRFSLLMLADNVALMRDLARVSPQSFSSQFLHLLHAYVYFLQPENANLSLQNLRVFLEPVSDTESPPLMDRSSDFLVHIDGFNSRSGIIPDLVQACCHYPEILARVPAIKNIFFDHFDEVAPILRTAVSNFLVDGSSYPVFEFPFYLPDILPVLSRAQQVILLQIEAERIQKMRLVAKARAHSRWDQYDFLHGLDTWLLGQWLLGCLAEALAVADEIVEHLRVWSLSPYTEDAVEFGFGSPHPQISRSFILLDMGLFDEAIKAVQLTKTILSACTGHMNLYAKGDFLHHCTIQTRVLVRTGRNQEALQFLRRTMLEVGKRTWTQGNTFLSYFFHLLLVELAVVRGHVGQVELALKEAQRAVAVCRKAVVKKCDRYYLDHGHQQHVLLHSLTTLSNCLASVRRHEEALIIAEEAASVFDSSAPHMWTDFVYGGRRQEFGGNTFHALSRRLATSGQLTKALGSAQKSVDLYRELAGLAPRHLPTLASSLRNLASILWNLGSLEASIAAGEEAVSILGMVAETEPYFLGALAEALDHLAEYHPNERDFKKACSAVTQCADVRRKIALRPPEPDFIFEKLDAESEKEIYQAEDLLYTTVFFALADKALEMSTDISVPEAISDKAESAPQTSNSPQDSGIVGMPGKRLIAESPPEMKSMEILWWSLLVVLGVALAVSCVVSKIDKSE